MTTVPTQAPRAPAIPRPGWITATAAILLCVFAAALLISDTATLAPSPPSLPPEALALTRDLLAADMPEGVALHLHPTLVQGFIDTDHLDLAAAQHLVEDIVEPQLQASIPLLQRALARIWAGQFTPDELAGLRIYVRDGNFDRAPAFLATPLGQKYEILGPSIDAAMRNTLRLWLTMATHAAFAAHPDQVRQLGLDPTTAARLPARP